MRRCSFTSIETTPAHLSITTAAVNCRAARPALSSCPVGPAVALVPWNLLRLRVDVGEAVGGIGTVADPDGFGGALQG